MSGPPIVNGVSKSVSNKEGQASSTGLLLVLFLIIGTIALLIVHFKKKSDSKKKDEQDKEELDQIRKSYEEQDDELE